MKTLTDLAVFAGDFALMVVIVIIVIMLLERTGRRLP